MSRRPLTTALAAVVSLLLTVVGLGLLARPSDGRLTPATPTSHGAASTSTGVPTTSAAGTGTGSAPAVVSASTRSPERAPDVVWRSEGETVGAWVQLTWPEPTLVDHVEVQAAPGAPFSAARLVFDNGDALPLTVDGDGVADVSFEPREVSSARLVVTEAPSTSTSVAVARFAVDGPDAGALRYEATGWEVPSASSSGASTGALVDGDVARGQTGAEWTASAGDASPWVQLSWRRPLRLASVQVFGPTATAVDPAAPWNAPLHGVLRFGDGSTVLVSGIAGGGGQPTTIAFAPRTSSWVRLELTRTVPTAAVSLREFRAYTVGTTPPRWPQPPGGYATTSSTAGPCSASSEAVGRSSGEQLALVCPAPGAAVSGTATIVVTGPPGTPVEATGWVDPPGSASAAEQPVASGVTDGQGRAVLVFSTATLPSGPFAVRVVRTGPTASASEVPLYVQLVNRSGVAQDARGHAPNGMTLQFAEEFTAPLSISRRGTGTMYAATKPSHEAGGSFGDAWFADPAEGAGTISTLDSEYLRIRVQPSDPATTPWGLRHTGGIVSSLRVGGSGFAAQYGYFEARMLGAPGTGSWPAFWMLDTENATPRGRTAVEVDAVELYGHNTSGSCHTTHNWGYDTGDGGVATCHADNGFGDWALSWHTYGVRFVPGGVVFSIDGVQVATYTGLRQDADPFYFMVDLALGGGWPVDLAATGEVTDLYVDWIRVYT